MVLSVLQATGASLNKLWTGLINLIRRLKSFWREGKVQRAWSSGPKQHCADYHGILAGSFFSVDKQIKGWKYEQSWPKYHIPPLFIICLSQQAFVLYISKHSSWLFLDSNLWTVVVMLLLVTCSWICVCNGAEMVKWEWIKLVLKENLFYFIFHDMLFYFHSFLDNSCILRRYLNHLEINSL